MVLGDHASLAAVRIAAQTAEISGRHELAGYGTRRLERAALGYVGREEWWQLLLVGPVAVQSVGDEQL